MNGYWGNKGTVSIRFNLYGVSICVLNCHLAAHDQFNQVPGTTGPDKLGRVFSGTLEPSDLCNVHYNTRIHNTSHY